MTRLLILIFAIIVTLGLQPSTAFGSDLGSLINQYRQANGLRPLTISSADVCAAQQWASRDAQVGSASHDNLFATISRLQACGETGQFTGEIIAGNAGAGPDSTFLQFRNSPEHNSIMLDPTATAMGVGLATGTFQGFSGFDIWVVDFSVETGASSGTSLPTVIPPTVIPPSAPVTPNTCVPPTCASTVPGQGCFGCPPVGTPSTLCIPPLCASTQPSNGFFPGLPATTAGTGSFFPGAPSSTPGFFPGLPASTGGPISTSGGAAAGTPGTICVPPTCASTGR